MNNLIFPPADAKPAEIANALFVAITQHQAYHDAAVHVVDLLHPLNLHTLQFLRKKFQESNLRYQSPKGTDFAQGEAYILARIDEFLANAIELVGCEAVKQAEHEREIPWGKLPEWVQFVAMDKDLQWWGYDTKPSEMRECWMGIKNQAIRACKTNLIPFTAPDWRTSLRQRPKQTDQ